MSKPQKPPLSNSRELAVRNMGGVGAVVSAFESETAAVFLRTSPQREHVVLKVLVAMLVLAFSLMAVVKLDRVVTGVGRVVSVGGQIYISPLDRALVREVRVKAGDTVRKGDVLATLDSTLSAASVAQLEQQIASDRAAIMRLEAEHDDRPYFGGTADYEVLQMAIWQQRQAEYNAVLADFDSRSRSTEATIAQSARDAEDYAKRLKLARELEQMNLTMQEGGYVTRMGVMEATDNRVEVGRLLSDAQNQLNAGRHTLAALQSQRAAYLQKWHSDVGTELVTVRNRFDQAAEELKKAAMLNQLDSLDAPSDAIVLKVGKISAGSVASAATDEGREPLFTLVPLDAPVEAEVMVQARDIGFIQPGDHVEVKLDAYRFLHHGTAKGMVKTISEGSFTTDDNGQATAPYFRARIAFTEVKLQNVPSTFRLIPGMTVIGDILVGKRTILSYLVEGALRTGSEAMREP